MAKKETSGGAKEKEKQTEKNSNSEKLILVKQMLESAEKSIRSAQHILLEAVGNKSVIIEKAKELSSKSEIVEGVFDGENMIGPDKKKYPVPANYASKSMLIPGDILKLTISEDGTFIFKQIGPVERKKIIGTLNQEDGKYKAIVDGKVYDLLLAAVTYFKGQPGDQVTLVVPEKGESAFAALENVIHNGVLDEPEKEKPAKKTKK